MGILASGGSILLQSVLLGDGTTCLRALLPLANFERASSTRITILQPDPVEGIVPAAKLSGVPIRAEIKIGKNWGETKKLTK